MIVAVVEVNVKESISTVWKVDVLVCVPLVTVRVVRWMMVEVVVACGRVA